MLWSVLLYYWLKQIQCDDPRFMNLNPDALVDGINCGRNRVYFERDLANANDAENG